MSTRYFDTPFIALAHRGGGEYAPNTGIENTLQAFRNAVDLGFTHIETDVQATRDGVLVCFHDPTLERVAGEPGTVGERTAAELATIRVNGTEPIPTLDDVFEALPDTCFNIDLKTEAAITPLVATLARHQAEDRVVIASFSQRRLSTFRHLTAGRVPTGMAAPEVAWSTLVPILPGIIASPGAAVQAPVSQKIGPITIPLITRHAIDAVHQANKQVHVWTIDDPEEMTRLIDLGVDGLISDRPDVLKEVLVNRGLWHG
ncbi:MAG: glycerophosphodiester phosphodiesterase [Propionibacteriaceae bacterium]|jgi:glycerophosphoryl diester phosphodiesterase|nr:glycerophosphodiester phosphodiesterase [Propionibacteriaceae bacterium]